MTDTLHLINQNGSSYMIQSMTGYGKASARLQTGNITVKIRSVNGKNADISIKTSLLPKDKELEIRKKLSDTLTRGSIDLFASWEPNASEGARHINTDIALEYCRQIDEFKKLLNYSSPGQTSTGKDDFADILATVMRMPDVIDAGKQDIITPDNWPEVEKAIDQALEQICEYRRKEGAALYKDVCGRVDTILDLYSQVEALEGERISAARERILKAAEEMKLRLDTERLEQEMIYYLEKLDINEEKVRLRQHCKYFKDTIDSEKTPGKKLGFIIQEMGREINTTGSKANHAGIQKLVVQMKDELEKIREQSMNIL